MRVRAFEVRDSCTTGKNSPGTSSRRVQRSTPTWPTHARNDRVERSTSQPLVGLCRHFQSPDLDVVTGVEHIVCNRIQFRCGATSSRARPRNDCAERRRDAVRRRERCARVLRVHWARKRSLDPSVRRIAVRPPELRRGQRRLPRELSAFELRRLGLRALDPAADQLHASRTGRTRAPGSSTRWGSSAADARHLDGRDDRAGLHRDVSR